MIDILDNGEALVLYNEVVNLYKLTIKSNMQTLEDDYGNISRKIMRKLERDLRYRKRVITVNINQEDFLEKIENRNSADKTLNLIEKDLRVLGFGAKYSSSCCVYSGYSARFIVSLIGLDNK